MASTRDAARELREALEEALAAVVIEGISVFVERQLTDLRIAPQRRQSYLSGLSVSYDLSSRRFVVDFTSDEAEAVENGVPAVDLKQAFARSPKKKKSQSSALGVSDWYFDVPFHFASSKEAEAFKKGDLKLGPSAEAGIHRKSGVGSLSKPQIINALTEAALLSMPEALKLGARAKGASKKGPATPGTETKLYREHVSGLLAGVQMAPKSSTLLAGASGPGSHGLSFTTFRRVSAASDPSAWWIPAQPGAQLTNKIETQLKTDMSTMVDTLMR